MLEFILQEEVIRNVPYCRDSVEEGARIVFWGLVRNKNLGKTNISKIEYSCYPKLTIKEGKKILAEALNKFEIRRVHCIHRVGTLLLQERAVRIEVGSEHREAAFYAIMYIMKEIKTRLPIWKKEFDSKEGLWIES